MKLELPSALPSGSPELMFGESVSVLQASSSVSVFFFNIDILNIFNIDIHRLYMSNSMCSFFV